jgi:uncharacterized glyoxalase superfamily protein PhnB
MLPSELDHHELHGVQPVLQVADMNKALAYYQALGFEVDFIAGDPPAHARVSSGDREGPTAVRLRLVPLATSSARPGRGYYWIHVGRDLDGLFAKFQAAGVEIAAPPTDQPWGLRDFRVFDGDDNLFVYATSV